MPRVADGYRVEVVATSIPRPVQLAFDASDHLVVLSHGRSGDVAGEIFWLDPIAPLPVDASRVPRVVIPFASGPRKIVFGSLAVHPKSGDLYLGEENGNRIYRLTGDKQLHPLVVGLDHLLGGSSIAVDEGGRLLVLDYASFETQLRSEAPLPPSLDWLASGDYQGPLVFRLDLDQNLPLPRQLEYVVPLFPKPRLRRVSGEPLDRLISVAPLTDGALALLSSAGDVFILTPEGDLRHLARLPSGHYQRTNMAVAHDGSVFVSGGFHIRAIYRVSPAGVVTTIVQELGDPEGIAVDRAGVLYVAETSLHRIIRIVPSPR